jgi:hypothetical protein
MGQVMWAWNEISAALAGGMTLSEVWKAATLDGIEIPYPQFRVYVSRMRRRRQTSNAGPIPRPQIIEGQAGVEGAPSPDPFKNLREQREKKKQSGFEFDPFSDDKDLIE